MPPRRVLALLVLFLGVPPSGRSASPEPPARPPNVLLIVADDLGWGELGCYGQGKIRTPRLDRLAEEGVRFRAFYAGSAVCAPSRATLLSGLHTGHGAIRDNKEMGGFAPGEPEGQWPLPPDPPTLARRLHDLGYATACIGKWGLGGPGSDGEPSRHGFDRFFGYLCQRQAHNHYPDHLWRDGVRVDLRNPFFHPHVRWSEPPADPSAWERFRGPDYAPDLLLDEALAFLDEHADRPFFLFFASALPHVALQPPDDLLAAYPEEWDPQPYLGDKGYLPHPRPGAAYAAMISRLDRDVGALLDRLDALGLADRTLVLFTSDNGPTWAGGVDAAFFDSTGGLRGLKGSLFEGGLRVPLLARGPAVEGKGRWIEEPAWFPDLYATILDAAGAPPEPAACDGVSLAPLLAGRQGEASAERVFYWELARQQAVRKGRYKLVRRFGGDGSERRMLFDLLYDEGESLDIASELPEVVSDLLEAARSARRPEPDFPNPFLDDEAPAAGRDD